MSMTDLMTHLMSRMTPQVEKKFKVPKDYKAEKEEGKLIETIFKYIFQVLEKFDMSDTAKMMAEVIPVRLMTFLADKHPEETQEIILSLNELMDNYCKEENLIVDKK